MPVPASKRTGKPRIFGLRRYYYGIFGIPIAKKLKISEVQKELHETTFTVSGIVKAIPNHYAEIASPFAGRVTRSFIRLGQKVDKGSPCLKSVRPTSLKPEKSTTRQSRKWN